MSLQANPFVKQINLDQFARNRGLKPGDWIWGTLPASNERVRGPVANSNGLQPGYVRVYLPGSNQTTVVRADGSQAANRGLAGRR